MSKKNFLGRILRTGLLATVAATMLMGNMAAFAAEDDEFSGIFWQENVISGTVTEVGDDSITVRVNGAMEEGGFAMGMPGNGMRQGQMPEGGMPQDGQTQPERPDGELPDGQTPPELPDGQTPPELPDGQTPPELPDGELPELPDDELPELPDGELPELPEGMGDMTGRPQGMPQNGQRQEGGPQNGERPEGGPQQGQMGEGGMPQGGFGMGAQLSSEVTISIDDATVVLKANGEDGTISDITEGSNVMVMLDGSVALSILVSN